RQFILRRYAVGSMFNNATTDGILEDGSQTQYNAMVDMAKNNNALVIAMMHNWHSDFTSVQEDRLKAMIDYADAQGVEIMTLEQAMQYFGNTLDIGTDAKGYFRVGADGKVSGSELIDKLVYKNIGVDPVGINNSTLGTSFDKGFVTVATFKTNSGSGFPVSNAGTLETYYLVDQYTIQQRWYPYDNPSLVYYRQFRFQTNTWSTWSRFSMDAVATVTVSVPAQTVNAGSFVEYQF
ncbi:MAG: pyocin knob domain-containing protein, partial [Bacillota bacterium]